MQWLLLSNKRSFAPLLYLTLQSGLLIPAAYLCSTFTDIPNHYEMLLFWVDVIVVILFFFICHLKDPGYVPYDAVFFTEPEEASYRSEVKLGAMIAANHGGSHINFDMNNTNKNDNKKGNIIIPGSNSISNPSSGVNKEGQESRDKQSKRRHPNRIQEMMIIEKPILSDTNRKQGYAQFFSSDDLIQDHRNEIPTDQNPNTNENDKNQPNDANNCMDIELSIAHSDTIANAEGPLSPNLGDRLNQLDDKDDIDDPDKISLDLENLKKSEIQKTNDKSITIAYQVTTKDTTKGPQQVLNQSTDDKQQTNNIALTLNTSCNLRSQTDEDQSKLIKVEDISSRLGMYQPLQEEEVATARNQQENKGEIKNKVEISCPPKLDTTCDNMDPPGSERQAQDAVFQVNEVKNNVPKENMININNSHTNTNVINNNTGTIDGVMRVIKPDENLSSEEFSKQKNQEDMETIYVERRYCIVCSIEQPIRAKHCKYCQRCCASYDHHCPWLGTCIGERNHMVFYWFLLFQFIETTWTVKILFYSLISNELSDSMTIKLIKLFIACSGIFFTIMVGSLFVYHSYLATINMTTWENMSWHKISYLKEWPKHMGSPFSNGIIKNIKYFCFGSRKQLRHWKLPKIKKPKSTA